MGRRAGGERGHPDGRLDVRDTLDAAQLLEYLKRHVGRTGERRPLGRVDVDRPFTHVLVGHELPPDDVIQRNRQQRRDCGDRDDQLRMIERPSHTPRVPAVEPVEEAAFLRLQIRGRVGQLQEARAQHRRQREADEHRDQDRERHRPAERVDEALRIPVHERDGQEDDDQRERRGHDGQRHLPRALDRGLVRRAPLLLDVAEDVLEHHDRVVDDDAHGERDGEQGHVVQREPHDAHQRERRDDRGRDRERRDDDGPDVPDEEHHDDGGEQRAEDQMLFEGRNRCVDEPRVVADDRYLYGRGQRPLDGRELCAHALDDGDGVLAHGAPDVEHDGRRLPEPDRARRALERVLRVSDIGDADRGAALRGDDDVVEVP